MQNMVYSVLLAVVASITQLCAAAEDQPATTPRLTPGQDGNTGDSCCENGSTVEHSGSGSAGPQGYGPSGEIIVTKARTGKAKTYGTGWW